MKITIKKLLLSLNLLFIKISSMKITIKRLLISLNLLVFIGIITISTIVIIGFTNIYDKSGSDEMPQNFAKQLIDSDAFKQLDEKDKQFVAGRIFDTYVNNGSNNPEDTQILKNNFIKDNAVPWYYSIGAAAGRGFSGSMSGIARHLGYDDAADRLNNVKTQLSNELYQPDRATSDAPLTTKAYDMAESFGTGVIEMAADPVSILAGITLFYTIGLLRRTLFAKS
jgi:hypothetical protein